MRAFVKALDCKILEIFRHFHHPAAGRKCCCSLLPPRHSPPPPPATPKPASAMLFTLLVFLFKGSMPFDQKFSKIPTTPSFCRAAAIFLHQRRRQAGTEARGEMCFWISVKLMRRNNFTEIQLPPPPTPPASSCVGQTSIPKSIPGTSTAIPVLVGYFE